MERHAQAIRDWEGQNTLWHNWFQTPAEMYLAFEQGRVTGREATATAVADSVVTLFSFGYFANIGTGFGDTTAPGYSESRMSARLGVELLSGLGTGAVAATGWVGRILFGLDVASNVSLGGQGAIGIANDSPTIQNTTNLLFGLMGLGGGFISKALSKANLPAEETVETVVDTLNTARQRTDNALDNAADQVATEIVDKIVDAEKAAPDAAKVSEVARELPQVASRTQPPGRPVGPDDEVPNGFSYDLDDPRFQTYSEGGSKIDFRIDENTLKIDWIEGPNASSFLKEIIDAHDGNIDRIIGFTSDKLGDASDEVVLRAANKIAASLGGGWRAVIEFRDGKRHVILTR